MELQSRFAFLLQPIRDLTKNWDVDVAAQLDDYLSEIAEITISFDGGATQMNFAEAALLIQGSTCVYSKKVEYLYALVFQTLDLISSKRHLAQSSSVDVQGRDTDTSFAARRTEDELLMLDDLPVNANIDMVETNIDSDLTVVSTVPRTPMSLIPLQESERATSTPLLSRTGELLGSRVDFKMNTGCVHSSGALMLEPLGQQLVIGVTLRGQEEPVRISCNTPASAITSMLSGAAADGDTSDVFDESAGCGDLDIGASPSLPAVPMSHHRKTPVQRKTRVRVVESGWSDPWRPLDPHLKTSIEHKPFKKGVTQRVPAAVRQQSGAAGGQRRKRKASEAGEPPAQPLADFLLKSFYSCSTLFPKSYLKAPMSTEFEGLYWAEQKSRKQQRMADNKRLRLRRESVGCGGQADDDNMDSYQPLGQVYCAAEDDSDDTAAMPDSEPFEAAVERLHEGQGQTVLESSFPGVEPMALEEGGWEDPARVNYEDLVRNYVESTMATAAVYANETELSRRVSEWENRIKPTLADEDTHPVFDIHEYGSQVLNAFKEKALSALNFHELAERREHYEICRMFSATLQLANDYNVEISSVNAMDSLRLKLLSTRRNFENVFSYRAPSLHSQH